MSKHTPGPWHIDGSFGRTYVNAGLNRVARCDFQWMEDDGFTNAALIASAPDMLAALEGCIHHDEAIKPEYRLPESLMRQIRSAIRKAKGLD